MAVTCVMSAFIGGIFFSIGAWPIPGFLGLDVLLLYWAFRANYRAATLVEHVRLDTDRLTVSRTLPNGRKTSWQLEPNWLQVDIEKPNEFDDRLVLRSHGNQLVVGSFLTPLERSQVASALRQALNDRRAGLVQPAPRV